jgi:hypothetical protein
MSPFRSFTRSGWMFITASGICVVGGGVHMNSGGVCEIAGVGEAAGICEEVMD